MDEAVGRPGDCTRPLVTEPGGEQIAMNANVTSKSHCNIASQGRISRWILKKFGRYKRGSGRCRVFRSGSHIHTTSGMVTSGTISIPVAFFSFFLFHFFHFWLARAHSNAHFNLQCRLNRPGGSCYPSKQTSPFTPSTNVLKLTELHLASTRYSLCFSFSPSTTTGRPGARLFRLERKQFV